MCRVCDGFGLVRLGRVGFGLWLGWSFKVVLHWILCCLLFCRFVFCVVVL